MCHDELSNLRPENGGYRVKKSLPVNGEAPLYKLKADILDSELVYTPDPALIYTLKVRVNMYPSIVKS
jgi:hypothetical protein